MFCSTVILNIDIIRQYEMKETSVEGGSRNTFESCLFAKIRSVLLNMKSG